MTVHPIVQRLRSMGRARQIVSVLARYGFRDFAQATGLDRLVDRGLQLIGREGDKNQAPLPTTVRIREALEELGPTFVKVGQILSTRPDLIPPDLAEELSKLQSSVDTVAWTEIEAVLASEYPEGYEAVFESIEREPLASGSMAQVHRATLAGDRDVVVKILRPGIRELIAADVEISRALAELAGGYFDNLGIDPAGVVDEFARELERELDLAHEARSTERMRRDMEDVEGVVLPRVHRAESTPSVLVLERIEGTLLTDVEPDSLTPAQAEQIAATAADAIFRQCLVIGFFHADPHPGNIILTADGRLAFIDCGMTGHVDPSSAELLAKLVHAVLQRDLDRAARAAVHLAAADRALLSDRAFRADVWRFMESFQVESLDEVRMGPLLTGFFELLRSYKVRCPADLVYLIKALTTIEAVVSSLAPDFDLVAHVRPYVERLVKQRYGFRAVRKRLEGAATSYVELVEELPDDLRDLMASVRQKRLSLGVEHRGLDRLIRSVESASMNVSYALLVSALVMGSAILLLANTLSGQEGGWLQAFAVAGMMTAMGIALFRVVALHWPRRK